LHLRLDGLFVLSEVVLLITSIFMAVEFFEHLDDLNANIIDFVLLLVHNPVVGLVAALIQFV